MALDLILAAGDHAQHTLLDPHGWGLVFWTGVTFMLVVLVLYAKAWGPLLEALDAREQGIAGQRDEAEKLRADAAALKQRYEDQLEGIRKEAQAIIDEGEADKKRILEEAKAKADAEAKAIRERAERDIKLARDRALDEVSRQAVTIGMSIAERVIGAEVDAKRHAAIVDEVLAQYERS